MIPREHLAVIGSGASAIYLLKHLMDQAELFKSHLREISIFEKSRITGMGMPYSPRTTDRFNMSNISSEELPELVVPFADWLRALDAATLESIGMAGVEISDSEVYNRLALGRYLNAQYQEIIARLAASGIRISEYPGCEITDIRDHPAGSGVSLHTAQGSTHRADRVVIATGHYWVEDDRPGEGFYASPWPIFKLLPGEGERHDFAIGTLGASLSAFDVITSLAHRHGTFSRQSGSLTYHPHAGTGNFKIVMHAATGLLPHLQFDQDEPRREIYRHVDREELLAMRDKAGFLRIGTYYDKVCRPALAKAFAKDDMEEMVKLLADPGFSLRDFVAKMTGEHSYRNAFEGMRSEMAEARESVLNHKPIHWKEVIDDLMYTLNFHAELMPAEDHITLHSVVMPFLMNVIAAMPLPSGETMLALYDAGALDMIPGKVSIPTQQPQPGMTTISVDDDGKEATLSYRMFIDCSGQRPLELEDFPFHSLVKDGSVRKARAGFADPDKMSDLGEKEREHLFQGDGEYVQHIGGIDIDAGYRVIGPDGKPNPRIYDIAFPHTSGIRPYSYGLQACSHTGAILIGTWVKELEGAGPEVDEPLAAPRLYEEI